MKKVLTITAVAALTVSSASAYNIQACAGCHGANFEKKAMNVSKIVKEMSRDEIVKALKGYKDGSYGGAMKSIMTGQVKSLSDEDIEAIAAQIAGEEKKAEAVDATKGAVEAVKSQAADMAKGAADKAVDTAVEKAKEVATEAASKAIH